MRNNPTTIERQRVPQDLRTTNPRNLSTGPYGLAHRPVCPVKKRTKARAPQQRERGGVMTTEIEATQMGVRRSSAWGCRQSKHGVVLVSDLTLNMRFYVTYSRRHDSPLKIRVSQRERIRWILRSTILQQGLSSVPQSYPKFIRTAYIQPAS